MSRRHFVAGALAAGGLVLSGLPFSTNVAEAASPHPVEVGLAHDVLAALGREDFAALLGQRFRIADHGGRSVNAVLAKVLKQPLPAKSAAVHVQPRLDCFTLVFHSSAPALPSATYQVEHARLGRFPLFLVPGPGSCRGTDYVAVFNRLLS
jgi:hypothetical protein